MTQLAHVPKICNYDNLANPQYPQYIYIYREKNETEIPVKFLLYSKQIVFSRKNKDAKPIFKIILLVTALS
jgi:3-methyladenine DNA glycosylase AlkD